MTSLPDGFLDAVVADLDGPDITGIILGGSYNRGEATRYSDVDIAVLVAEQKQVEPKRFEYRDGLLLSVATKSVEGIHADIEKPERAIWVVPGLRDCRVLLDKDGSVGKLISDLQSFTWEPLQDKANRFAGFEIMIGAEEVHKILSGMAKGDRPAIAFAASVLLLGLTEIVAVQRGILVKSDNTYFAQVEESVGTDSDWARYHRLAVGIDPCTSGLSRPLVQGAAVLRLYSETLKLVRHVMLPEHRAVAEQAALITEIKSSA